MKETLKQAGYKYVCFNHLTGEHVLADIDNNNQLEAWTASKGYSGYTIIYKNTTLEFVHSFNIPKYNQLLKCPLKQIA